MSARDVAVVLGTRPEVIKLAPVIQRLRERAWVIHTGQHYDDALSGQFFRQFDLPAPDVVLEGVGAQNRGTQISVALGKLTHLFTDNRPGAVVVQGDTNAVSSGAQAGQYLRIPVVHVEAGLRSQDRAMPEEINRLVAAVMAEVHCAPTERNATALRAEGIAPERVVVTGNTVVEATLEARSRPARRVATWFPNGTQPRRYAVATIHRPENTDQPTALRRVLQGLRGLSVPVVFLAHPRTRKAIEQHGLGGLLDGLIVHEPPASTDFLALAARATVLVSDSGGVQEECTVLKVPLAVIRRSTERPEAIEAGFAKLVPPEGDVASIVNAMIEDEGVRASVKHAPSPYGDGQASERIATIAGGLADGLAAPEAIARAMHPRGRGWAV